jgi:hypothetical protein
MAETPELVEIQERIDGELKQQEGENEDDVKITHVENLFIISYLTKALQDILIQKSKAFQYPLLLIDLPLALAILIVNVERILYVKVLGYVMAHIQYDVAILKSLITTQKADEGEQKWQERVFDFIRKFLRFTWGVIILLFILPVWPLIWIYNQIVQTLLIAVIYYFLMFSSFAFPGGFLVFYILLATVTFLVSSITIPFIFKVSVYFRALFSLEKKSWKQVDNEAKMAFVNFYKRLHGNYNEAMTNIKARYNEEYKAEGGVYYMLLKFLHYTKDKFWKLKEKKMDLVVEKIQDTTVEFVDEYYEEKNAYDITLRSLSPRDLRRTVLALTITIFISLLLVFEGSNGKGLVGPILLSFVDQEVSQQIWTAHRDGRGYYEDMFHSYGFFPNFLEYLGLGVDWVLNYFYQAYYFFYPIYLDFLGRYYLAYFNIFLTGIFYNLW